MSRWIHPIGFEGTTGTGIGRGDLLGDVPISVEIRVAGIAG